jgi:hypothetical protein
VPFYDVEAGGGPRPPNMQEVTLLVFEPVEAQRAARTTVRGLPVAVDWTDDSTRAFVIAWDGLTIIDFTDLREGYRPTHISFGTVPSDTRARLDVRLGDIRDARFVEEACRGVDVVFHLAALIAIPYSYVAPESFVDTNVRGTLNVLEAAQQAGLALGEPGHRVAGQEADHDGQADVGQHPAVEVLLEGADPCHRPAVAAGFVMARSSASGGTRANRARSSSSTFFTRWRMCSRRIRSFSELCGGNEIASVGHVFAQVTQPTMHWTASATTATRFS